MYPYQKPQLELLLDLIKEANPGIQFPFTPDTMTVGTPSAQAVPSGGIADTNVLITAKPNSHWFGSVRVQYRRIDVVKMFKNMFPLAADYYAATSTMIAMASKLNLQYGTSFVASDFVSQGNLTPDVAFSQNIAAASLCYTSSAAFQMIWRKSKPLLIEVAANQSLPARLYSGGNDFATPGRKPQGEYLAYGIDFTNPNLYGSGSGNILNSAAWAGIFAPIFTLDSRFDVTKPPTATDGVQGLVFTLYALPNPLIPEANSAKFKNVMAVMSTSGSWFQGKILMHYN